MALQSVECDGGRPQTGLKCRTMDSAGGDGADATEDNCQLASTKALNIPELVDMVLVELDCKTLFSVQFVSKTWHARIKNNKNLKKKLFQEPATFEELKPLNGLEDDFIVLAKGAPFSFSGPVHVLNPFAVQLKDNSALPLWSAFDSPVFGMRSGVLQDAKIRKSVESSWKGMLFSQPHYENISVEVKMSHSLGSDQSANESTGPQRVQVDVQVEEHRSARLGEMVKAAEEKAAETHGSAHLEEFDFKVNAMVFPMTYSEYLTGKAAAEKHAEEYRRLDQITSDLASSLATTPTIVGLSGSTGPGKNSLISRLL